MTKLTNFLYPKRGRRERIPPPFIRYIDQRLGKWVNRTVGSKSKVIGPREPQKTLGKRIRSTGSKMSHTRQERGDVTSFYQGRSVLVTGATGFVGGCLLEKLLRCCPGLRKVYVLVRPKQKQTAADRLHELLSSPLFSLLDAAAKSNAVAVSGDVTQPDLGLSPTDQQLVQAEVSVVFHCAAHTSFAATLRRSATVNLKGTHHVLQLCRRITSLQVLVYMSTAFCNCVVRDAVVERIYPCSVSPDAVLHMLDILSDQELESAKKELLSGHPNAYTFSKQLAENLLEEHRGRIPVVIVRPSLVLGSAWEPFPGWPGGLNSSPTAFIFGCTKGVFRVAAANPCVNVELVPVDVVVNIAVTAAAMRPPSRPLWVLHATSGERAPLTWGRYVALVSEMCRKLPSGEVLAVPDARCRASRWRVATAFALQQLIPAILLRPVFPQLLPVQKRYWRGIVHVRPFTYVEWWFRCESVCQLRAMLTPADRQTFPVDVSAVCWEECLRACVMGVRTHLHGESPDTLPAARRNLARYQMLTLVAQLLLFLLPLSILWLFLDLPLLISATVALLFAVFLAWL